MTQPLEIADPRLTALDSGQLRDAPLAATRACLAAAPRADTISAQLDGQRELPFPDAADAPRPVSARASAS